MVNRVYPDQNPIQVTNQYLDPDYSVWIQIAPIYFILYATIKLANDKNGSSSRPARINSIITDQLYMHLISYFMYGHHGRHVGFFFF